MNKEEYKTLEETKRLVDEKMATIRRKECEIKILEREINQLYEFINDVQRIGELETNRIERRKMDILRVITYADEVLKAEDPPYIDVVLETIKEMLGDK